MLVDLGVCNYEGRSAIAESTDTSQLVERMTGECIISSDYEKHNNLSTRSLLSSIY